MRHLRYSPPWDPIAAVLVDLLSTAIRSGGAANRNLTLALQTLPLTCRDARDHFRLQPTAPWLLMYQLHVHKLNLHGSYYDAVPSGIDFNVGDQTVPKCKF